MAKFWTAAEIAEENARMEADRRRILAERQPRAPLTSVEAALAEFGPGEQDGFLGVLIGAGFTTFSSHQGGRGWKLVGSRVAYVDSWGGAWGLPEGEELSHAEYCEHARRFGTVSLSDVVDAAARARQ